jgi:hypothetical protein
MSNDHGREFYRWPIHLRRIPRCWGRVDDPSHVGRLPPSRLDSKHRFHR